MSRASCEIFVAILTAVVVGLVAGILCSGCGEAIPAPIPAKYRTLSGLRPDGRPILDGRYDYLWNGGKGTAVLRPEGGWESNWCGDRWIGSWEVTEGAFSVCEARLPHGLRDALAPPPNWYRWSVVLEKGEWKGKAAGGGVFEVLLQAKGGK